MFVYASMEQATQVVTDLTAFVHRVALNENARPDEVAALPRIAEVVLQVSSQLT